VSLHNFLCILTSRKSTWQLSVINLFINSITQSKANRSMRPQMTATFHTYGPLLHHTQHARSRWCTVQCTPLHCNNWIYGSFDDCWFAKHCTKSVFKISRPTGFQKAQKHFHILQFMKSLRAAHFLRLACRGGGAHPCLPSVTSLAVTVGTTTSYSHFAPRLCRMRNRI